MRWERDSGNLTQYLAPTTPLPGNSLSGLVLHNGKLYISGYGGLAIYDRKTNWIRYTSEDIGLDVEFSSRIAMVGDVLWLAVEGGLAQLYPDGHWEVTRAEEGGLPSERIERIVPRQDGVYVVVAAGPTVDDARWTMRFKDGDWEQVEQPTLLYLESQDGTLWNGDRRGLYKSMDRGSSWESVLATERWTTPRAFDDKGQLYVTTDDMILVLADDKIVETYRFTDVGPEINYVNIIQWDGQDRMWVATDGRGMSMFDGERWHNWQPESSEIRDDAIRGLAIGNDKLYAGTFGSAGTGGVNVFDFQTQRWTNYWPGESELSAGGVGGIAIDARGRAFLPTSEGVLDILDGEHWQHVPMPLPERGIVSTSEGLFDSDGDYWVGTYGLGLGLWRYDGSQWTVYDLPVHINALALDHQGRLWLGTSEGLIVHNLDGNWLVYTAEQLPLGNGWIQDVLVDQEGRIWIIGYTCLVVFNGEEYQAFSESVVGASSWGDALSLDPQGKIWMEAGNGIAMFLGEPEIGSFANLTLEPAVTIPEKDILLSVEEIKTREMPALPVAPPQTARSLLLVVGALVACGGFLTILLAGGGVLYLVLRNKKGGSGDAA